MTRHPCAARGKAAWSEGASEGGAPTEIGGTGGFPPAGGGDVAPEGVRG